MKSILLFKNKQPSYPTQKKGGNDVIMLKGKLLHPEILQALGSAGHGAKILISDGNYPHSTGVPETAKKVFMNLMPGVTTVPQVLEALVSAIPIEAAGACLPAILPHMQEYCKSPRNFCEKDPVLSKMWSRECHPLL